MYRKVKIIAALFAGIAGMLYLHDGSLFAGSALCFSCGLQLASL